VHRELLQATLPNQSTTPITYAYDGMNRRLAKTDNIGTYQYLYGNLKRPFQLPAMRDPSGVLSMFYYDDTNTLIAMDKGGTRYYVAIDQLGSPRVLSNTAGTVVKYLEYDSFGLWTFDSMACQAMKRIRSGASCVPMH
jgi:YD repeat-containing protein